MKPRRVWENSQAGASARPSVSCLYDVHSIHPKSLWFKLTCENPVNVSYFFNIIEVKYTDKTLTRGFACLDDFYHFTICRFENLVLSNELIKVELLP